jgi:putative hydrolase of the HAD superfamily
VYKGILLDIDNTLYQYAPLHNLAQQAQFTYLANTFSFASSHIEQAYNKAKSLVKSRLPASASSHNRLLYAQTTCELLGIDALQHSLTLYNIYWDTFLNELSLTPGAEKFFTRYGHLPICLLTDLTAHIQHRKVAKLELMKWADYIVTSEEAGCEKPHPYMFELALRKLKLTSSEVCMVGDNFKKDILGAQQLGIDSYWFTEPSDQEVNHKEAGITPVRCLGDIQW